MKKDQPRALLRSFQTHYYRKTVGFSGIQTRIVKVEGEHADLLTTITAQGPATGLFRNEMTPVMANQLITKFM